LLYKVQASDGDARRGGEASGGSGDDAPPPLSPAEAAEALGAIRQYMDRSTKSAHYTAMSGFVAGVATLIGCAVLLARNGLQAPPLWDFAVVWSVVALVALVGVVWSTLRKARARAEDVLNTPTRMVLGALCPAGFTLVVLTVALAAHGRTDVLPGVWLLCYGTGLFGAALFARSEFQKVGVTALVLGAIALACPPDWGTLFMGLGFGALHLGYGVTAWRVENAAVRTPARVPRAA
jgi:hypothetical protein